MTTCIEAFLPPLSRTTLLSIPSVTKSKSSSWLVGYDDFDVKRLEEISKNTKIVTYCSVGYRSERIGEKLMKQGFTDVSNLKGSLFKWANQGYELED